MIVGEFIADFCESAKGDLDIPTALIREAVEAERARLDVLLHGGGTERADAIKIEMQQTMTDKVGIFRTGADLEEAVHRLQGLLVRSRNIGLRHKADGPNPELVTAYRTRRCSRWRSAWRPARSRVPRAAAPTSARTSRRATMPRGCDAR